MSEAELSLIFDEARAEIDKIDAQAHGAKKRIVQDLAKRLESKLPVESIAQEIVVQLKGRISERHVLETLDEKYKSKSHVARAKTKPAAISQLEDEQQIEQDDGTIVIQRQGGKAGDYRPKPEEPKEPEIPPEAQKIFSELHQQNTDLEVKLARERERRLFQEAKVKELEAEKTELEYQKEKAEIGLKELAKVANKLGESPAAITTENVEIVNNNTVLCFRIRVDWNKRKFLMTEFDEMATRRRNPQ